MKRPVWRKISTWCNKRSFIQKYKIKRTSKYEIIHCIRVFFHHPPNLCSWFAFSFARSKSSWIMKCYILNISNWALCLSHISNFQARNHCCTVLSIFFIFVTVLFSIFQHVELAELRTLVFWPILNYYYICLYFWTEIRKKLSRGEKVRLS